MKILAFVTSSLFLLASCDQVQFNRETNRSSVIDGVLTAESKALAQSYAEALNEGNDTSLALTGEQPLSLSKIKKFRTALYKRVAKPRASLAENQSSEDLVVEMAEQVSFALSDAGISGKPAILAPISQVSLNYTDLSKSSLERVMTTTLFAADNFSEEDGQNLLNQIIQRSNSEIVPKLLRAMINSSDQLVMTQEELIYNFSNHMDGQPQDVVAGVIAESLELMEEYDVAATKPVQGFRDSVDPEVQAALAEVFANLDAAAAAAAVGRKLIDANRNLDELNESLAKAKALAKAMAKQSKKEKKKTEVAAAPAAPSAPQEEEEEVVANDPPAGDTTAPVLHATPFTPADGASSVALSSDLVIRFSEDVVAGDGNVVLKSGATVVQTIAASATSISDDTVTIDIDPLSLGTSYHVLIDDDAFEDAAGNSFAGLSNATDWNFDAVSASVTTFDFSNAGDYTYPAANIDVSGGAASLKVLDLTIDSAAKIAEGSSNGVSGSGDNLALSGSKNLLALDERTAHWNDVILYYKFDGNANDSSGNNRHGTAYNTTYPTDSRIGSNSVSFDGDGDYIDTGWAMNLGQNETLTMMFWLKSATPGNKHIAGVANAGYTNQFYILFANGGFLRPYLRSNDGSSYDITGFWTDGEPYTGGWEHFAMVFDGPSDLTHVYLNGRLENTKDFSGGWADLNTGANLFIGTSNNNGTPSSSAYYTGQLDEFVLIDAVLTNKEIQTIYQQQRAEVAGYYTSEVFDVGQDLSISSLAVNSAIPHGKPITPNTETTSSYPGIVNAANSSTLGTGLVALYQFEETSGTTANDTSGNNHHASKTGSGSNSSPGHVGKLGHAFDLQDYYFEVADHDDFETANFSVGAWIHPDTNQIGSSMNWRSVASEGSHNSSCTGWNLRYSYNAAYPDGLPALCMKFTNSDIGSSGVYEVISPSAEFSPGRWNHILATFDGTTARIYLNGVEIVAKTEDDDGDAFSGSAIASNSHPFYIGGYGFDGLLDELGVWNRALSAAEVAELYKRGGTSWNAQYRACSASDCSDAGNGGWSQTAGLSAGLSEAHNASAMSGGDADYTSGSINATSAFWHLTGLGASNVSQLSGRYWQMRLTGLSHGATHMPSASSLSFNSRAGNVVSGAINGPYPASKPELVTGSVALSSLTSMAITSSGNVKFAVSNDGGTSFKYWDGAAWSAAASGVGASAADTTSNISSLAGGNVVVKVIFETNASGSAGGSVSEISLTGI